MMIIDSIEYSLQALLPEDRQAQAHALARVLTDVASGTITPEDAQAHIARAPTLRSLLRVLAGKEIEAGAKLVCFGSNNQLNNITIGDIAGGDIIKLTVAMPASKLSPEQRQQRHALLRRMQTIWISGFLERTLAEAIRFDLGLQEKPDAVQIPLHIQMQELTRPVRAIPMGRPVGAIFDELGESLLILGQPGAGKTTLLLELCRVLLVRAERNETYPVPIVLNLSSWSDKHATFAAWLSSELQTKYDIPAAAAETWVKNNLLLPLLDGLDEVAQNRREACVNAINDYRRDHLVAMAVCAREGDYAALTVKLRLQGAVVVQPLTHDQVDDYLEQGGAKLATLRAALAEDQQLRDIATTPLMLNVLTLAFANQTMTSLENVQGDECQRAIWDAYITAMLRRRGASRYSEAYTRRWLGRLARTMRECSLTEFSLGNIAESPWRLSGLIEHVATSVDWVVSHLIWAALFAVLWIGTLAFLVSGPLAVIVAPLFFLVGIILWGTIGRFPGMYAGEHAGKAGAYVLARFYLLLRGRIPSDYQAFFNACVERLLLRRVGNQYIFIHRLLLEHVASSPREK